MKHAPSFQPRSWPAVIRLSLIALLTAYCSPPQQEEQASFGAAPCPDVARGAKNPEADVPDPPVLMPVLSREQPIPGEIQAKEITREQAIQLAREAERAKADVPDPPVLMPVLSREQPIPGEIQAKEITREQAIQLAADYFFKNPPLGASSFVSPELSGNNALKTEAFDMAIQALRQDLPLQVHREISDTDLPEESLLPYAEYHIQEASDGQVRVICTLRLSQEELIALLTPLMGPLPRASKTQDAL